MIHEQGSLVADDQASIVAQPSEGAFDFLMPPIASQKTPILGGWSHPVLSIGADPFDAPGSHTVPQRIVVVAQVGNNSLWVGLGRPRPTCGAPVARIRSLPLEHFNK